MKIYGFYFVALMLDNWSDIVTEQLQMWLASELFSKTDKVFIRVYYEKENDLECFKKRIKDYSKITLTSTNTNEFEFGTLKILQDLSFTDDFYCYYFHSKGVSISEKVKNYRIGRVPGSIDISFSDIKKNVNLWRKYMEYFIIDKYQTCIDILDQGFDACGTQLMKWPRTDQYHFSGNFWWAKSEYIKKLQKIDTSVAERHQAEKWIGSANGKFKCLYFTEKADYKYPIVEDYRII